LKTLSEEQQNAITRLYETDATLLYGKMGAGKTIVALSAAQELLAAGELDRVLIVAPARVCKAVWPTEGDGWSHIRESVTPLTGTPAQRESAWQGEGRIFVLSIENIPWFVDTQHLTGRVGLIIDELTRFKTAGSQCVRKLRRLTNQFCWRVGMTGTPVSDSWLSLYAMTLMLDQNIFGTRFDKWRSTYFEPVDFEQRQWAILPNSDRQLTAKISGLIYRMPDYRESLPKLSIHTKDVMLSEDSRIAYIEMAKECFVDGIEAVNEAVVVGKLQQLASGFLYDSEGDVCEYGCEKIDAAIDVLRDNVPTIVVYWFQADLDRLRARLPNAGTIDDIDAWNAGECSILLLHPRSAGHGLNLAKGGARMLWIGPQWSRDLHDQTIARLWRTGQNRPVDCIVLCGEDTIDHAVMARLAGKADFDRAFNDHISSIKSHIVKAPKIASSM
jgi:hypothetical protein